MTPEDRDAQTDPWIDKAAASIAAMAAEWFVTGARRDIPADVIARRLRRFVPTSPAQWPEDVVERADRARDPDWWTNNYDHRTPEHGNYWVPFYNHRIAAMRAALATLPPPEDERVKGLVEALDWYAEQVAGCRKLGSIGDPSRHALDRDGGTKARSALASYRGGA